MPGSFFDPASAPGLSAKAKDAVSSVFQAMTEWQNENTKVGEKHAKHILDKMTKAAAALGWPEQVVDAARVQMQAVADMQTKTVDHIRGAWEEQLRTSNPMTTAPDAMLAKLQSMPRLGSTANLPNVETLQAAATAPLAMWMEFGKQWQTFWIEALEKPRKG